MSPLLQTGRNNNFCHGRVSVCVCCFFKGTAAAAAVVAAQCSLEECGELDKVEYLQLHENREIYQRAFNLIEKCFGNEDTDTNVDPVVGCGKSAPSIQRRYK
jgi:hypothetical protein